VGNFDWIAAFSACALSAIFEKLKLEVESDVKSRNGQLSGTSARYEFHFIGNGSSFLVAVVASGISGMAVKFKLTDSAIVVTDAQDKKMFEASLTLNDEGECVFLIDSEEKRSWQLRKRALAQLLFTSPF
jgi:hypothetical protein